MTLALRRSIGNTLITSKFDWSEYWIEDGPDRSVKTVNNVDYFLTPAQKGRTQVYADVTLIFWDEIPNAPLAMMDNLRIWANSGELLKFTDHAGVTHNVRMRNLVTPERDDSARLSRKYFVDAILLRTGFY